MSTLFLDYGFNLKSLVLSAQESSKTCDELWEMVNSKLILTVIFIIVGALFYLFSPYQGITLEMILILGISAIPNSFGNYFVNTFKVKNRYDIETKGYAIQLFSLLLFFFALEQFFVPDIFYYALGILFSKTCYFFFGFFVFQFGFPRKIKFNYRSSIKAIWTTSSFAIHMILSALIIHVDTFILSLMSTLEQVGVYQAGMRMVMASMLVAVIISDAFIPEISGIIREKKKVSKKLSKLFEFIVLFALLTIITVFFYKETLILLLFSRDYLVLQDFIFIILSIITLRYIGIVPGIILTSFDKQRIRAEAVIGSIFLSIFFNIILIPRFGIQGAFMASLGAHIFLNIYYLYFSTRTLNFFNGFSFFLVAPLVFIDFLVQNVLFKDSLVFLITSVVFNLVLLLIYVKIQKIKKSTSHID